MLRNLKELLPWAILGEYQVYTWSPCTFHRQYPRTNAMRCSQCAYIFDDDVSEVGVQYVDAQSDLRALWIFIKGCSACTGGKRTDLSLVWAGLPPGSTWLNEVFNLSSISCTDLKMWKWHHGDLHKCPEHETHTEIFVSIKGGLGIVMTLWLPSLGDKAGDGDQ